MTKIKLFGDDALAIRHAINNGIQINFILGSVEGRDNVTLEIDD